MSKHNYEKLYLLKYVFLNFLSDHRSIDAAKQLRYADHYYYEYSHKKLGRTNEKCLNGYNIKKHKKRPTYDDLIIAYASRYKAYIQAICYLLSLLLTTKINIYIFFSLK